jgi:hypothetical protein
MNDDTMRAFPRDDRSDRLRADLPVQESEQPDPALQMSTSRVGAAGWAIFAVIAVFILTVVLYGLNGPSETSAPKAGAAAGAAPSASASNTAPAPTPTAPENGPGAKP